MEKNVATGTPDVRKSKVMLARLSVSSWSAKRFDDRATDEVASNHQAAGEMKKDIGRFNKRLILKGAKEYEDLGRIESRARTAFHESTLSYDGDGIRLMPVRSYMDYVAHYHAYKDRYSEALETFLTAYPTLKEEARRALNGLFVDADYPSVDVLRSRYTMKLDVWPFPEASHFSVDCLSPDAAEAIRDQIEEAQMAAFARSKDEVRTRLLEVVSHMAQRLIAAADGGRLHDSVLENVKETIAILPKLNFLEDPQITKAIDYARERLSSFATDSLRTNRSMCIPAAQAAQDVQRVISQEFGMDLSQFVNPDLHAARSAGNTMGMFA